MIGVLLTSQSKFSASIGLLLTFCTYIFLSFLSCCVVWNQKQLCMKVASKVLFLFAGKQLYSYLLVSVYCWCWLDHLVIMLWFVTFTKALLGYVNKIRDVSCRVTFCLKKFLFFFHSGAVLFFPTCWKLLIVFVH